VEKIPEPVVLKEGPSDSVEEAFLRAGAAVIEAAPVLRDFQKEAATFVPSIVKRRPPPKKVVKKAEEPVAEKVELVERSFATTVEDGEDDVSIPAAVETTESPIATETLKRPLEEEKKMEVEAPTAPPKRRRRLNAAPDV
jgi:hypothetical protein